MKQEYVYVANGKTNDIAIYSVDPKSGCISPVNSNNIGTGVKPIALAGHPDRTVKFMYSLCAGSTNDIWIYKIGQPTPGNLLLFGPQFPITNGVPKAMKFRGDGKFLYVLTDDPQLANPPSLTSYDVDATKGTLTAASTGLGGTQPVRQLLLAPPQKALQATAMCIDRTNTFAYVTLTNGMIQAVKLDGKGGLALQGKPVAGGSSPSCIAIQLNFLYQGSNLASSLYTIDTGGGSGTLTVNPNTIATNGQGMVAISIPITGNHLYSVNGQSGDVSAFDIVANTGVLKPTPGGSPFAARLDPPQPPATQPTVGKAKRLRAMAINALGTFAYMLDNGVPPQNMVPVQVSVFAIDGAGNLTPAQVPSPNPSNANSFQITSGQDGVDDLEPDACIVHYTN